ncbi:hypothetical protein [Streptomyces sp. NPDC002215]|uniref:hypothetical protein n=1 Tax=Streptomyces sp. NPDC002215 TaxID=3154412 RepID=UPI0033228746
MAVPQPATEVSEAPTDSGGDPSDSNSTGSSDTGSGTDQGTDQGIGTSGDQSTDTSTDHGTDQSTDTSGDQSTDTSTDHGTDTSGDQSTDTSTDHGTDQSTDTSTDHGTDTVISEPTHKRTRGNGGLIETYNKLTPAQQEVVNQGASCATGGLSKQIGKVLKLATKDGDKDFEIFNAAQNGATAGKDVATGDIYNLAWGTAESIPGPAGTVASCIRVGEKVTTAYVEQVEKQTAEETNKKLPSLSTQRY